MFHFYVAKFAWVSRARRRRLLRVGAGEGAVPVGPARLLHGDAASGHRDWLGPASWRWERGAGVAAHGVQPGHHVRDHGRALRRGDGHARPAAEHGARAAMSATPTREPAANPLRLVGIRRLFLLLMFALLLLLLKWNVGAGALCCSESFVCSTYCRAVLLLESLIAQGIDRRRESFAIVHRKGTGASQLSTWTFLGGR